ncbi:MAG: hypothetical protein ABIG44_10120 [Planctomycetota bacterium]
MSKRRKSSPGRTAMVLMLIALLVTVCVAVYLFLSRQLYPATPPVQPGESGSSNLQFKLTVLLAIMLGSALLILFFVIGSYLLIRVGRMVTRKEVGGEPTEYVDAWSHYRLSDEQIEAATSEEHPARGDLPPDLDEEDEYPDENPPDPQEPS